MLVFAERASSMTLEGITEAPELVIRVEARGHEDRSNSAAEIFE